MAGPTSLLRAPLPGAAKRFPDMLTTPQRSLGTARTPSPHGSARDSSTQALSTTPGYPRYAPHNGHSLR